MILKNLTIEELMALKKQALIVTGDSIGDRPSEDTDPYIPDGDEYPWYMSASLTTMIVVVLLAAFSISAQHISDAATAISPDVWGIGPSMAALAEFAVLVITMTMDVLFRNQRNMRWLLGVTLVASLAVAFVGNWTAVQPGTLREAANWLGWLVVAVPPLTTATIGFVIERFWLRGTRSKAIWKSTLRKKQRAYDAQVRKLEGTPLFDTIFDAKIRQGIIDKHVSRGGSKAKEYRAYFMTLNDDNWAELVGTYRNLLEPGSRKTADNSQSSGETVAEGSVTLKFHDGHDAMRPSRDEDFEKRKSMLALAATSHPELFTVYTNQQIADFYGMSTGSVSNIKQSITAGTSTPELED